MAKILVADDNSNIQKMVGLALKDQGIDVVAVGNGEAAVRKISDVHPDLVLADVFMPVRNGYEVCQYVKADSALSHIPVILLVGAFDPLDEQEAQRVGADGVLKKPFVPPDPLISMVKSALARAGVLVGGAAPPPVPEVPIQAADMITPRSPAVPRATESFDFPEHAPTVASEPVQDEVPGRPEPVRIDSGSQPLAFGSLLESAGTGSEDSAYATTARPELERDWKSGSEEEEVEEEEEEPQASWRRDAGDESLAEEGTPGQAEDWKGSGGKRRHTHWAPEKEKGDYTEEAAEADHTVTAHAQTPVAETAAPLPSASFSGNDWGGAPSQKTAVEAATMEAPAPVKEEPAAVPPPAVVPAETPAPELEKPAASTPWYSAVASPWDAEVQKATQLASTWDALTAGAPAPWQQDPSATVDALPQETSETVKAKVEEAALPAATVEAIREEAQQVAEIATQEAPAAPLSSETQKAPEPSMDELVAKVLSKMSPDVLQAVTREILKPVVEAMVRDELNSKK